MIRNRIPDIVVKRLVTYLRVLQDSSREGYVSSAELGDLASVNGAQVRKDLALFGEFGKQGVGYPVEALISEIAKILGADRDIDVVIIGVGELGTAVARYISARKRANPAYRFTVKALFDQDKRKIGSKLEGVVIQPLTELSSIGSSPLTKVGIIAVPAAAAQDVLDAGVAQGIRGFLNFAPIKLKSPPGVRVHHTDVTLALQELAFYV